MNYRADKNTSKAREFVLFTSKRRDESRRGTHECARYVCFLNDVLSERASYDMHDEHRYRGSRPNW